MWKVTLLMISFAGLGEARGEGVTAAGDSEGVGSVLGDVLTAGTDGLASGELEACCWSAAHPVATNRAAKIATWGRHLLQFAVIIIAGGKV